MSNSQPADIRLLRTLLRHWPIPEGRGRGILLRAFGRRLRRRNWVFEVEPGIVVPGQLDDYVVFWSFVGDQERDASFVLSQRLIRRGDTILDIGANIGLWVMGAARRAGAEARIHAFEPVPAIAARLKANLKRNRFEQVQHHLIALSDSNGTATFRAPQSGNSGAGSLASATDQANQDEMLTVQTQKLDDFCAQQGLERVDFLKIDVEGAEILVFQGGARLLSADQAPIIMVEISDKLARAFGSSASQVKSLLQQLGYGIYAMRQGALVEVDVESPVEFDDFFAFKPDHFTTHAAVLQPLQRTR